MPGISVFQATLLAALQWMGAPVSRLVPSPRGPRQPGQFSAKAKGSKATKPSRCPRMQPRAYGGARKFLVPNPDLRV